MKSVTIKKNQRERERRREREWDIHTYANTHTQNGILFIHEKEGNPAISNNMDEP